MTIQTRGLKEMKAVSVCFPPSMMMMMLVACGCCTAAAVTACDEAFFLFLFSVPEDAAPLVAR